MLFSNPLHLDVPVMPRVGKFLAVHYPGGIVVNPGDGRLLQLWVMCQTEKVKVRTYGRVHKDLSATISVQIGQLNGTRRQVLLNDSEVRTFNKLIDLLIYQEFFAFVEAQRQRNPRTILESIRTFVDRYDFSHDDIAEETLRIAYHRHRSTGHTGFDDSSLLGSGVSVSSYSFMAA